MKCIVTAALVCFAFQYRRGTRAKPAPAHARAGRYAGAYNNRLATVTADGG